MPRLKTLAISASSMFPTRAISVKIFGTGHEPRSTRASQSRRENPGEVGGQSPAGHMGACVHRPGRRHRSPCGPPAYRAPTAPAAPRPVNAPHPATPGRQVGGRPAPGERDGPGCSHWTGGRVRAGRSARRPPGPWPRRAPRLARPRPLRTRRRRGRRRPWHRDARPSPPRSARTRPSDIPRRSLRPPRRGGRDRVGRGHVVEEEQRLRAHTDQVVHAHGDEVDPDRVVSADGLGDQKLGPDAVGRGHQHRVPIAVGVQREQPAEAADRTEHLGPGRRRDQLADAIDGSSRGVEIDAGRRVGRSGPRSLGRSAGHRGQTPGSAACTRSTRRAPSPSPPATGPSGPGSAEVDRGS